MSKRLSAAVFSFLAFAIGLLVLTHDIAKPVGLSAGCSAAQIKAEKQDATIALVVIDATCAGLLVTVPGSPEANVCILEGALEPGLRALLQRRRARLAADAGG